MAFLFLGWSQAFAAALPVPGAQIAVTEPPAYTRAQQLYRTGRFEQCAELAEGVRTSDGLALAARALLARTLELESPKARLALYQRSEALARQSIALDEENAEAYRLLAISIGYIARTQSPVESWLQGYAGQAKDLVDRALALEPSSPWSHAALGGWHAEIVSAAGTLLADQMAGASLDQAEASFKRAIELDPSNPVLHFEFAVALIRTKQNQYRNLAQSHLSLASLLHPKDAFEEIVVRRARTLSMLMKTNRLDGLLDNTLIPTETRSRPETLR